MATVCWEYDKKKHRCIFVTLHNFSFQNLKILKYQSSERIEEALSELRQKFIHKLAYSGLPKHFLETVKTKQMTLRLDDYSSEVKFE